LGIEAKEEEKAMKKKFAKLSKREQEKVEAEYHRMKPEDFDEIMSTATRHTPNAVRLPSRLVEKLKTVAEREGKTEYQTIVKAWIEERLQKESKVAR
jgi:predicted DNA binding CopG/RHH family protein